jgi:hypothetical protein
MDLLRAQLLTEGLVRTVTQHGRQMWTFVPVSVPGGLAIVAMRTP